jgi:DNA-binding MarR family transcriptional regulator
MGCSRDFCRMLSYAGRADRYCIKTLKANILSAEAKVLAAIVDNPDCIIKDIPSITGLSVRHSYNAINKLIASGVLVKDISKKDKRNKVLNIIHDKMCDTVCRFVS